MSRTGRGPPLDEPPTAREVLALIQWSRLKKKLCQLKQLGKDGRSLRTASVSGRLHDYLLRQDFGLFLHDAQVQMTLQEVDPKPEVEASSCVALHLTLRGLGYPLAGRPLGMRWNVLMNRCSVEGLTAKQHYLCHAQPARPDRMNPQISLQLAWTKFGSI